MKKIALTFLTGLALSTAQAQQDEQASLYMQNPLYYNPAYAGSRQSISMVALGRFQWVGFEDINKVLWSHTHHEHR
jgi:hypothetical protein